MAAVGSDISITNMSSSLKRVYGENWEKRSVLLAKGKSKAEEKSKEILAALKEPNKWRAAPTSNAQHGGSRIPRCCKNPFRNGRQLKNSLYDSI